MFAYKVITVELCRDGELIEDSFGERGKFACDEFGNIEVLPTNPPTSCQAQVC